MSTDKRFNGNYAHKLAEEAKRDRQRVRLFAAWIIPILVVSLIAVFCVMFIPASC